MLLGYEFSTIKASLRDLTFSDRLEIYGREGGVGQVVRVDGLNRPQERTYETDCIDSSLPRGEWLIKNDAHSIVIVLHSGEPQTQPAPIRGFATEWVGGEPVPWLVVPLARRLERVLGVSIPVNRPVWAAIPQLLGWNWWEPVRALARGENDNRTLGINLPEEPVWSQWVRINWRYGGYKISIWRVQSDVVDSRIPIWDGGWIGTLHYASEAITEPYPIKIQPARIVGFFAQGWPHGGARLPKSPGKIVCRPEYEKPEEEPVELPEVGNGEEYLVTLLLTFRG